MAGGPSGMSEDGMFCDGVPVPKGLRGLPADIIRAARRKQQAASNAAADAAANDHSIVVVGLPLLADMVHSVLANLRRRAIYRDELLSRLLQSHRKQNAGVSEQVVGGQIDLLLQLAPDWCSLKQVAHQTRDEVETSTYDVRPAEKTLFTLADPAAGLKYSEVRKRLVDYVEEHRQRRAATRAGQRLA